MRRPFVAIAVAASLAALVATVRAPLALATIRSLSPPSATVQPGGDAGSRVSLETDSVSFLSAGAPGHGITVQVNPSSGSGQWDSTLIVSTSADTPPGTYNVSLTETSNGDVTGSRTFTLHVQPPPTTTTTSTPAPTTTASTSPTSTVPTTTTTAAVAETTTVPETTTTVQDTTTTTVDPRAPFAPPSALAPVPLVAPLLFLPLKGELYGACFGDAKPCSDPSSALVLLPGRTTALSWQPVDPSLAPVIGAVDEAPAFTPVGIPPNDPTHTTYLVAVLDLRQPTPTVSALKRGFDGTALVETADEGAVETDAMVSSFSAKPAKAAALAASPFGPPELITDVRRISGAKPVVLAYAGPTLQVLYAIQPPADWGANRATIPVLGAGTLPRRARSADGRIGVVIAVPDGFTVAARPVTTTVPGASKSTGGLSAWLVIGVLSVPLLIGGVVGLVLVLRRPGRDVDDDLDGELEDDFDDIDDDVEDEAPDPQPPET